jgi:hypothetical protein
MMSKFLAVSAASVLLVAGASASAQAPVASPASIAPVKAGVVSGVQRATPARGRVNNQLESQPWEFWAFVATGVVITSAVLYDISDDGDSD